jgi:hypothetical protein
MITTHNNIFYINTLSYNKNNNIYNTNNTIFYMNTLNYKRKNNIYNTHYYINTCGWAQTRPDPTWRWEWTRLAQLGVESGRVHPQHQTRRGRVQT